MAPSIRPVWEERLVCRRCGGEFCLVSGGIPGFVVMGMGVAPILKGEPPIPGTPYLIIPTP